MKVLHFLSDCSMLCLLLALVPFLTNAQDITARLNSQDPISSSDQLTAVTFAAKPNGLYQEYSLTMSQFSLTSLQNAESHFDAQTIAFNEFHEVDVQTLLVKFKLNNET